MKVKFKRLTDNAVLPAYSRAGDAALDLTATSQTSSSVEGYTEFGTGLAVEIPPGHVGLIFPRSSISNVALTLCNAVGVVDSNYRGEIKFRFKKTMHGRGAYSIGDRIGQMIIMPYPAIEVEEVTELSDTNRGEQGYGSSGR